MIETTSIIMEMIYKSFMFISGLLLIIASLLMGIYIEHIELHKLLNEKSKDNKDYLKLIRVTILILIILIIIYIIIIQIKF